MEFNPSPFNMSCCLLLSLTLRNLNLKLMGLTGIDGVNPIGFRFILEIFIFKFYPKSLNLSRIRVQRIQGFRVNPQVMSFCKFLTADEPF